MTAGSFSCNTTGLVAMALFFMELLTCRISMVTTELCCVTPFVHNKIKVMKPEAILQADLLDIIFDGRNKAYGAYYLRRHQEQYLLTGMFIAFGMIVLLLLSLSYRKREATQRNIFDPGAARIIKVDPLIPKPPEQRQPPVKPRPSVAEIQDTRYRIVPPTTPVDVPPPDLRDISDKYVSTITLPGDSGDNYKVRDKTGIGQAMNEPRGDEGRSPLGQDMVDEQAAFPGGMNALQRFLQHNLSDPRNGEDDAGSLVRVNIRFVVEVDGSIGAMEFMNSGGEKIDREILRVLKKMPKWKPALKNGKKVAMYFVQPVVFAPSTDQGFINF